LKLTFLSQLPPEFPASTSRVNFDLPDICYSGFRYSGRQLVNDEDSNIPSCLRTFWKTFVLLHFLRSVCGTVLLWSTIVLSLLKHEGFSEVQHYSRHSFSSLSYASSLRSGSMFLECPQSKLLLQLLSFFITPSDFFSRPPLKNFFFSFLLRFQHLSSSVFL
jgi:hypothetical protein